MAFTRADGNLGLFEQCRALALAHHLVAMVKAAVEEGHHPCIGPRFAFLERYDFGFGAEGISEENRLGHDELVVTQIGHQRTERGITHRQSDHQAEGEGAVDQYLPELASPRCLGIDVQRLRIVGHHREQQIVRFGHRAADFVRDSVANLPLVEKFTSHPAPPCRSCRAQSRHP